MKPGTLIRLGVNDFWQVEGVFLGALDQESVVELVRLGAHGPDVYGERRRTSLIPERLLRALLNGEETFAYDPIRTEAPR